MGEAARVGVRDLGHRFELLGGEDALRNLRAEHRQLSDLALPVRTGDEPEGPPRVGVNLAALEASEGLDEPVDLLEAREAEGRAT